MTIALSYLTAYLTVRAAAGQYGVGRMRDGKPGEGGLTSIINPYSAPKLPGASSQTDVYTAVARPVLREVLCGYHGCIMAYGQTGSGKTHSLLHPGSSGDLSQAGLVPRLAADLFTQTEADGLAKRVPSFPNCAASCCVSYCLLVPLSSEIWFFHL